MSPALRALLFEANAGGVVGWLAAALDGARVDPLILQGSACEELAHALATDLVRGGHDAIVAPMSWWTGGRMPDTWPTVCVVVPGLEAPDEGWLAYAARHCALLVAGDIAPVLPRCRAVIADLPVERVGDLELAALAGWPA